MTDILHPHPRGRSRAPYVRSSGSNGLRIISVIGTRPEAIKMAPVALEAMRRPSIDHLLVATGQHGALFHQALEPFGLKPQIDLELGPVSRSIEELRDRIDVAVGGLVRTYAPDMLLVQGDTTTAWAAALAAHRLGVRVGHVEAGLRSHDPMLPWPEERNRVEIDAIAELLFAPTETARQNLASEPQVRGTVHVTGNTGIDSLLWMRDQLGAHRRPSRGKRRILVTCHRRENIGAPIASVCAALRRLAARGDVEIILPVHPNPNVQSGIFEMLSDVSNIGLVPPLDYPEMVRMMATSHFLLSDSGGLQEEAPALGVPLLILRDNTERPEALATGNLALIGTDADRIVAEASRLLDDPAAHAAMSTPSFPYGDGNAAIRILDAVERFAGLEVAAE